MIRLVHSADRDRRRRHDADVERIEREILDVVEAKRRELIDTATRLVGDRLAPVDQRAARILLDDIRRGELP